MPLRRVLPHQPQRALRVLQRGLHLRVDAPIVLVVPPRTRARHAVLQQHAGDAARCQPVADLRALQIHGQELVTPAGKHHHRHAGVAALGRIHRHRRPADIVSPGPPLASFGGPTDSGFGLGIASGTAPGQIGTCTWPGEGCQPSAHAKEWVLSSATAKEKWMDLPILRNLQLRPPAINVVLIMATDAALLVYAALRMAGKWQRTKCCQRQCRRAPI